MSVDGGVKVAPGVDLIHQFADHGGAGLSLIAGVGGQHGLPVGIEPREGHHIAGLVVVDLDLGVDTQKHRSNTAAGVRLHHRLGVVGGALGSVCSGGTSASGQGGQGQRGGQGKPKQFRSRVLFHLNHLKMLLCLSSVYRLRSRSLKNGVPPRKVFLSLAYIGRIRMPDWKTGAAEKIF